MMGAAPLCTSTSTIPGFRARCKVNVRPLPVSIFYFSLSWCFILFLLPEETTSFPSFLPALTNGFFSFTRPCEQCFRGCRDEPHTVSSRLLNSQLVQGPDKKYIPKVPCSWPQSRDRGRVVHLAGRVKEIFLRKEAFLTGFLGLGWTWT